MKPILDTNYLTVWQDTVSIPGGRTMDDYYFARRKDYVIVLACFDNQKVLTVTQWRPTDKAYHVTLPMGVMEDLEGPLKAAKRELMEETGYSADRFIIRAKLSPAAAFLHCTGYVVEAINAKKISEASDVEEGISSVDLKPIREVIATSDDMSTLAALRYTE